MERQSPAAPCGGLATLPVTAAARLFASPGPIYELETARPGFWRLERASFAAGFRAGDIVHNCFAYHLTPGGWMLGGPARGLGCTVIPGRTGTREPPAQGRAHFPPPATTATPDFLTCLRVKSVALGLTCSSLTREIGRAAGWG